MAPITLDMVRRRAEHNEGMVSTLEEISLHQQEIERIEGLGHICRHLKILYMQNNLVSKLENLHRLKELEYANFAVNIIRKIENLQRCESLQKLDLTVNFIDKSSLLTVHTLEANHQLRDLYLMGNPCADFGGYRAFVIGTLPQLSRLDGTDVTPTERILARQALPEIAARLTRELIAEGVDVEAASRVSDARDLAPDEDDVAEIMNTPEDERPWCPATRVAEQRESARLRDAQDAERRANQGKMFNPDGSRRKPRREGFPDLPEDVEKVRQCNEGGFEFRLDENPGGDAIVLDVRVGKFVDTSLVDADVHPRVCRVLCKGKLLQLTLPEEVRPDAAVAQRSRVTGSLVVTMPKLKPPPPRKDRTIGDDDSNELVDLLPDANPGPEVEVMAKAEMEMVTGLLDILDPRAKHAVEQRFGLGDGRKRSYREVGEDLGVTAEAARRLVKRAIHSVREHAATTATVDVA